MLKRKHRLRSGSMASYYSHGDRRRREGGKGKGRLLLYQRDDEANMRKFQSLRL